MEESARVISARLVSLNAHVGQVDKSGQPYFISHVTNVVSRVLDEGLDDEHVIVAWLHDVVEDTAWTLNDLRMVGFSEKVVNAVDAITHRPYEPRAVYYDRVKANPIALAVKRCDIASNTDPERVAKLNDEDRERLAKKYAHALLCLAE